MVSIIGSGNVAYHLIQAFDLSRVGIEKVFIRKETTHKDYLKGRDISTSNDLKQIKSNVIILAVSDHAIPLILKYYSFPSDAIILHTSGSVPISVFEEFGIEKFGCLYPLQTLSSSSPINYEGLPIFIEGSDPTTVQDIKDLAWGISKEVSEMDSHTRLRVHIASVFANNFTNHLLRISSELLRENQVPLSILKPLVEETVNKAFSLGPDRAQTGPAVRNDTNTIQKHVRLIKNQEVKALYELFSQQISEVQRAIS